MQKENLFLFQNKLMEKSRIALCPRASDGTVLGLSSPSQMACGPGTSVGS